MSLLQQVIQLLSESPGNIIYHLVALFALQAVFAISLSQWRRNPADQQARRMAWAAAAIFMTRVGLLFAGLALSSDPVRAIVVLPPLEQAIHTATAVLLVWGLIPSPARASRLGDALLLLILVVLGVMYFFFAQGWQSQALSGESYNSSWQATIWGIAQIAVLSAGLLLSLSRRHLRLSLRPLIIGLLLLAHLANFWNYPEIISTETDIVYWIRLGHLVIFPLWAVLAYRHSLAFLLAAQAEGNPPVERLAQSLRLSAQVIGSLQLEEILPQAVQMVDRLVDATFVGVAITSERDGQQLHLASNQPQVAQDQPRSWNLNLADWPAFRLAIEQKQSVELLPNGLGARQLHNWYMEMGIGPLGTLLIYPLLADPMPVGLLLLARLEGRNQWSERDKTLVAALADYIAQAIANSHVHNERVRQVEASRLLLAEPETVASGRLIALEEEQDRLLTELEVVNSRLQQAEARATSTGKQARDLAATVEEMERLSRDDRVAALETEIEALRESLIEAEEAMAMASAGEGGLSAEWVMLTITRYSGQLEAAQARIQALETEMAKRERGISDEVVMSLAQELRTPMTSIAGYTDLLLAETMGILGHKQRDFLQRVKANVERLDSLLDQIVQLSTVTEQPGRPDEEQVNVQEIIETAVTTVITQLREKNLRLDLDIADDLPALSLSRNALHQIMAHLIGNACQASGSNGRVAINARTGAITAAAGNGHLEIVNFMHLSVSDSGEGISVDDRARVFDPQYRADHPLIAGIGDTGAGLAVARTLSENNGGRIWVDSQQGVGSTFSVLFPILVLESEDMIGNGEADGRDQSVD